MIKKYTLIFSMFMLIGAGIKAQSRKELAIQFLSMLQREQYDSCYATFDTIISNKISVEMVKKAWDGINRNFGDFKGYQDVRSEKKDTLEKIVLLCEFSKMKLDLNLVYNSRNKVAGFAFTPPKNTKAYRQPDYSKLGSFYESKVNVQTGKYTLPGVLCLPNNVVNPPIALLLAGSGPNDKDESVGPNKILKDIALGLASNGIGTLRYDKRTLAYQKELAGEADKTGINEEVIDDAFSAIALLQKNPATKNSDIFIIGHSLGAYCAPWIAAKAKAVKGIVMIACSARPLQDLILEQVIYLSGSDSIDLREKADIAELKEQVKTVSNKEKLKSAGANDLPLGLPSFFWQSLSNYDPVKTAKKLKQPILVLQGERDYQVTMQDFEIWKSDLKDSPKNKFITYDNLNHALMPGEGKSLPAEYDKQGNVDGKVIVDISSWIKQN